MQPLHSVQDQEKVERLAQNMEEQGWQGAPLVKWDVYGALVTGVHRYEAAHAVLGWQDSEIPMIDLAEVFAEDGLDFVDCLNEEDNPYLTDARFEYVVNRLSPATREKYGIDCWS